MPPLILQALLPLLKKRDTYYVLAILILTVLVASLRRNARELQLALDARPKVETHVETKTEVRTQIQRVEGPERIVYRTVIRPGGVQIITRMIERGPITTTTGAQTDTEKVADKTVSPACPATSAGRVWSLNAGINPLDIHNGKDTTLGVSRAFGILSLGYAHTLGGRFSDGHRVTMGLKF